MPLLDYLNAAEKAKGIRHQIAVNDLRQYIYAREPDYIIAEMRKIENIPVLKYMQEAGLRKGLFSAYLEHLGRLGGKVE